MNFKTALVLAPHTDDGEFGCGGTIAKLVENGANVYYMAFSSAEKSVPAGFPEDILKHEVRAATKQLGIKPGNLILKDFEVREFPIHRQEILEELILIKKEIAPDLVMMPSLHDCHQDHYTVAMEGVRAFKTTTVLGYEVPWNNLTLNTTMFSCLEKRHIDRKLAALDCYNSQKDRNYAQPEYIRNLASVRGMQISVEFAEVFEVIRWVM
jgi:LmbE family N-acetylglucosaminyl deacetylase